MRTIPGLVLIMLLSLPVVITAMGGEKIEPTVYGEEPPAHLHSYRPPAPPESFDMGYFQVLIEANDYDLGFPPRLIVQPSLFRGLGSDVARWQPLVEIHFTTEQVATVMCLMGYESGGDPNAKNPTSSARGLMQIMASLWAPYFGVSYEALYDPETNIRLARQVYDRQGWAAWSPYNEGRCRGL